MQDLYGSEIEEDHVFVLSLGESKMAKMNGCGLQECKPSSHSIFVINDSLHILLNGRGNVPDIGESGTQMLTSLVVSWKPDCGPRRLLRITGSKIILSNRVSDGGFGRIWVRWTDFLTFSTCDYAGDQGKQMSETLLRSDDELSSRPTAFKCLGKSFVPRIKPER